MLLRQLLFEISLGWGGMIHAQFYWVNRDGKHYKVAHHEGFARSQSRFERPGDGLKAYEWMYLRGWARVTMEGNSIYVNTQATNQAHVDLSKAQREWLKMMRDEVFPGQNLEIQDIFGKNLDI